VSSRNNSYADLKELQEIEMEVAESVDALMTPHFEFKDVCFAYPTRPKKPILDDFHLSVRRGETVGLVGPSGGGKSTVISMIERFYDPDSGSVEFNGVDIKGLNLKWYRDQIGYVGQEPVLFDGSIAQNIAYGAPGATREEIEEAAKQANAYDFITSFPEGFETPVGERGTQLSGGQKQRVAIARALVKKPTVILLDEATSALDSESEAVVQEALDRLMESRDHTTIVIAHRLSTLSGADRIAFIADGVVKEYGSHNELLHMKHGRYKRLFEAQTRRASVANNVFGSSPNSTVGDEEEEEPDYETEIEEAEKNAFDANRARQMAKPDSLYMLIGAIGAILAGGVFPAWGIMFGETIFLLFTVVPNCACDPETNTCTIVSAFGNSTLEEGVSCVDWQQMEADSMREESFVLGGYWVAIAAACVIGNILTFYGFGMASERLNKRVRDSAFTALVRQEVAFYDKRSVGSITSQLEEDAARIHTFSGVRKKRVFSLLNTVSLLTFSFPGTRNPSEVC
jgi:ATP-binding cassette subfamily B (MDR/TAP) protein 1